MVGVGDEPPVIMCDIPGSFPESVIRERHPAIVRQVLESTPWPPAVAAELRALRDEEVIVPLPGWEDYAGRRWVDTPFLWAESFFYRRVLHATGYFDGGPWHGVDPYAPQKAAELAKVPRVQVRPQAEVLLAAVWGNRADLGFRLSRTATHEPSDDLLVDESLDFWVYVRSREPGRVVLVADNAGPELLPDLMLIDHLLAEKLAVAVDLHLKPYPYFVSDATTADLLACLDRLPTTGVADALRDGRLTVRTHPFNAAPRSYRHLPEDLRAEFAGASVTIFKGDLNYRRLVGDRRWSASTPFAEVTAYFPSPVLALRTIKSEVLVGAPDQVDGDQSWRVTGSRALIQFRS